MASSVTDIFNAIIERIRATARVETVYGETRVVDGRSVIPVARVRYGFGAGAGQGPGAPGEGEGATPGGGGGGGGVSVSPVGFLVLSQEGERFVPVTPSLRRLVGAGLLGFSLGYAVARRVHSQRI